MSITEKDKDKILRLRNEGKPCSKIREKYFPQLGYREVMVVIYGAGFMTALGTKKALANRMVKIRKLTQDPQIIKLAEQMNNLAWDLYNIIKDNEKRLEEIRKLTSSQKNWSSVKNFLYRACLCGPGLSGLRLDNNSFLPHDFQDGPAGFGFPFLLSARDRLDPGVGHPCDPP